MTASRDRHLDLSNLQHHLREWVPVEFPVDGSPAASLFIDPHRQAVGIRIPDDGSRPDTKLEHVRARSVHHGGTRWIEVTITDRALFLDGYPVLCAIADRVQLQGMTVAAAVSDALHLLGRLLERVDRMSIERELGLFGELLLLAGLCHSLGAARAVAGWLGPNREEHDVGVEGIDIEVKTTTSEQRSHWISSLTQLQNTPGRPLWLVSYQLTAAGSDSGHTLTQLITAVRGLVDDGPPRERLEAVLTESGWRDIHEQLFVNRWQLRSHPLALHVDEEFPRLTPARLTAAQVDTVRIPDVRYRVNLTGLVEQSEPPDFLVTALKHGDLT
jgi:hypothetical protein